jgi:hypothetical protein
METIETDYLVVGAGASGMAFADALIQHSDATLLLVDRRVQPGGHWNDDYPFVRLHQPSAYYGVDSRPLGHDRIDQTGREPGFYERASAAEIRDYYQRVLEEDLIPSGQVRFLGRTDYEGSADGAHRIRSLVCGDITTVMVRRCLVDATYMESQLPTTHTPNFAVDPDVRLLTPNDLVTATTAGHRFTVIGGGKTSMDTCSWLLDHDVDPDDVRWIRPRDSWITNRRWVQPHSMVGNLIEWLTRQAEASAAASDVRDLLGRFEAAGVLERLDPDITPSIYRGAILSDREVTQLRTISSLVRLGHVTKISANQIDLEHGAVTTDVEELCINCTAVGLPAPPARPVFEDDRITIQWLQLGISPFSAALIGLVEATRTDDEEKNRLCPPNPISGEAADLPAALLRTHQARAAWMAEPDIAAWLDSTRLNPLRGIADHLADPERASALTRLMAATEPATANLQRLTEACRIGV